MENPPAVAFEDVTKYKEFLRRVNPSASETVLMAAARALAIREARGEDAASEEAAQQVLTEAERAHANDASVSPKIIADGMVVGEKGSVDTEDLRRAA
jgi:hypothetical protein